MEYLKFLLADDEESIRKGLRFIIDWEKCGFKYCGEASNGKDAVNQIIDLQPDLVVLDIKMPGMTGVEVLSYVQEYFQNNKLKCPSFIILSGFSDFEYAQNAVNLGAKAYLLKPVDENLLEKTVLKIKKDILENRELSTISQNSKIIKTRQFLENIIRKNSYIKEEIPEGEKFFENYQESLYQCIIFDYKYLSYDNHQQFEKTLSNYFSFFTNEMIISDNSVIVLLKTTNQNAVINCIQRAAKNYSNITFICLGKEGKGLDGLVQSYTQAMELKKYLFYADNRNYISAEDFPPCQEIFSKDKINELLDRIIFCIETYDKVQLETVIQNISSSLYLTNLDESETKKNFIYCLVELRNKLVTKYPEREIIDGQTFEVVPEILEKLTYNQLLDYFRNVLNNFIENFNFNTSDSVIVKVISYIKNNYDKDLKLEVLGDMFNCNSAYLGKKFKKYTGVQFNTYLDNLRIEEAKDKLLHTDLKIYQISKLVGYANTDYFFMKFKKHTGLTPKEFKSQVEKNNE